MHVHWDGSTVIIDADGSVRFVVGKGVGNAKRHAQMDSFLVNAPKEYKQAFEQEEWSPSGVIHRFHSPSKR